MTSVGAAPQVSGNLVDLVHLHAVEFHDGSEKKEDNNYPLTISTQNWCRQRFVMVDWTK